MRAILKLEFFAENYFAYKRKATASHPGTERYADYLGRDKSRPWVARLVACDEHFGFVRQFVNGQIDYSGANKTGSRGVFLYYALGDGIYEVNERTSWTHVRRYFIRVTDAASHEISREEVERCLSKVA